MKFLVCKIFSHFLTNLFEIFESNAARFVSVEKLENHLGFVSGVFRIHLGRKYLAEFFKVEGCCGIFVRLPEHVYARCLAHPLATKCPHCRFEFTKVNTAFVTSIENLERFLKLFKKILIYNDSMLSCYRSDLLNVLLADARLSKKRGHSLFLFKFKIYK